MKMLLTFLLVALISHILFYLTRLTWHNQVRKSLILFRRLMRVSTNTIKIAWLEMRSLRFLLQIEMLLILLLHLLFVENSTYFFKKLLLLIDSFSANRRLFLLVWLFGAFVIETSKIVQNRFNIWILKRKATI